jgi:hypothetical protein
MQRSAQIRLAGGGTGHSLPSGAVIPRRPPVIDRGATPDEVAGVIAGQLAQGMITATGVFAVLLGREIRLDPIGPHTRPPDDEEAGILRLRDGEDIYVREGILRAGTIHCAKVTLKLAHSRICQLTSGTAWGQIRSGTPVGTVLGPHGLTPERRKIEVTPGGDPAVRAWRVSSVRSLPVCITSEDVPEDLCRRLASWSA